VPQIWDEASASYKTLSGGIIPAHNGFMVYTQSAGGSLTIPADARVHSAQDFYKSATETSNRIVLIAHDPTGKTAQQTIISFIAEATSGFDLAYDAYFLTGYAPVFYSKSNTENLALNALPVNREEISLPLTFIKNASSQFNIQLSEFPQGSHVYLHDLKTNTMHPLSKSPTYEFTSAEGDDPDRFMLLFSPVGIDEKSASNILVYSNNSHIFVNVPKGTSKGTIEIFDVQGRLLLTGSLSSGSNQFSAPAKGILMVRIVAGEDVFTRKIMINN